VLVQGDKEKTLPPRRRHIYLVALDSCKQDRDKGKNLWRGKKGLLGRNLVAPVRNELVFGTTSEKLSARPAWRAKVPCRRNELVPGKNLAVGESGQTSGMGSPRQRKTFEHGDAIS